MSKRKEVEVWVSPEEMKSGDYFYVHKTGYDGPIRGDSIKATLLIDLPEKEIKLTESGLRECFDTFRRLENDYDRRLVYEFYESSRQRLFGKDKT